MDIFFRKMMGLDLLRHRAAVPELVLAHIINMKVGNLCRNSTSIPFPWKGSPPHMPGVTALHISSFLGHFGAAKILVVAGADVNAVDLEGRSPLTMAARRGFVRTANLLIDASAHLNHRDFEGFTPLMRAAQQGILPMVELLCRRGADLCAADDDGITALDLAVDGPGSPPVFLYLLHKGVPLSKSVYGTTTTERALRYPELRSFVLHSGMMQANAETLEQLLPHAIDHGHGSSLIKTFYRALPVPVARRLTNTTPRLWYSPLCQAAASDEVSSARFLLDHGAEIEMEGSPEGSPLMTACSFGRLNMVKLLVRRGARLEYTNEKGCYRSAFDSMQPHPYLVKWFLRERFWEQRRLQLCPSSDAAEERPWAGARNSKFQLPRHIWQRWDESMAEVLRRRWAFRESIRGKVVTLRELGPLY